MKVRHLYSQWLAIDSIAIVILFVGQLFAIPVWQPFNMVSNTISPKMTLLEETEDHLLVRWDLSGFFAEDVLTSGETFQRISFNGTTYYGTGAVGTPEMPFLFEMIRLPDGTQAEVTVVSSEWIKAGQFNLYPRQIPRRDDGSPPPPFQKSDKAYQSNQPIPEGNAYVGSAQGWGGLLVTGLSVTPIKYIPASQSLEIASSITVRVDFNPGNVPDIVRSRYPSERMNKLHQTALLNPIEVNPRQLDADEVEPIRMLFIMQEEALEITQPLIDFHHNSGLRTDVWLVDNDIQPDEIRGEIRNRYEDGLEYVFIIGDGDRDDYHVPMYYWNPEDPGWQDNESTATHSDSWYVCLDGQVEFRDGEQYDDHLLELAIGRLTYDDGELGELEIQVEKIMDYLMWSFEDQEDVAWLGEGMLIANSQLVDGVRLYIECKEAIADFDYFFPHPEEWIKIYGNDNEVDNNTIIEHINGTGIGLLNFRGHGLSNRGDWRGGDINAALVNRMENRNRPFIYVSSACQNSNIATYFSDCINEKFQKHEGGAVCSHGSVISTYTTGNSYFDEILFRNWFDEGIFDLGYAAVSGLAEMVEYFDIDYANGAYPVIGRMNTRSYMWLGDPALEYRFLEDGERPDQLEVAFDDGIAIGQDFIRALITIGDDPVEGVRLCLRSEDDAIYLIGESNGDGVVEFELDNPIVDVIELFWGLYERNEIPAFGQIEVVGDFGAVQGQVTDFATGNAVENVNVYVDGFPIMATTDVDGRYFIEAAPAHERTVTARIDGWLSLTQNVDIQTDSTEDVDFALRFSELITDSAMIGHNIDVNRDSERELRISNGGNGPLRWSAYIDFLDRFDQISELVIDMDDRRLKGVVLVGDFFYVAGGNNNADPNYIYKLDRNGGLVESYRLPDEITGMGLYDLAWDGDYLYGSSGESIYKLTLDAEIVGSFEGYFNPNKALTLDSDGNFWIGKDNEVLICLDREGLFINVIDHDLVVKGLAWDESAEDGYNLIISVGDQPGQMQIYKANPQSSDVEFVLNLVAGADDQFSNGLTITDSYNPMSTAIFATVNSIDDRSIRVWNLDCPTDWVSITSIPEGIIEPDGAGSITLSFNSNDYMDDMRLDADLIIESDGRERYVVLPITLTIGDHAGVSDDQISVPQSFSIGQPYPNPFNAVTLIPVNLAKSGQISASLYDISGRNILTIADGTYNAGQHNLTLHADGLASGVYLILLDAADQQLTRKVVLLR